MNDVQLAIKALQDKGWTLSAVADGVEVARWSAARWRAGKRPSNPKALLSLLYAMDGLPVPKKRRYNRP